MGGWVVTFGNNNDFRRGVERLKTVFSVDGVPSLNVREDTRQGDCHLVAWAWNGREIPDVRVCSSRTHVALLCGVVTGVGKYGGTPHDQGAQLRQILTYYEQEGEDVVSHIDGSFSLFVYSIKDKIATLYVDRFASRAIWVYKEGVEFFIGNVPSAILAVAGSTPIIEGAGLWSLIHASRRLGTHGIFKSFTKLLAGQKAAVSTAGMRISDWWTRRYAPRHGRPLQEWAAEIASGLLSSAREYKKLEEEQYIFLSGGMDSRLAAAACAPGVHSITLTTSPNYESRTAQKVATALGIPNKVLRRSPYWYLETLAASALIGSGDYFNYHCHFTVPVVDTLAATPEGAFLLGDLLENFNKNYFSRSGTTTWNYDRRNIEHFMTSGRVPYTTRREDRVGVLFAADIRKKLRDKYIGELQSYAKRAEDVSDNDADKWDTFLRWADVSITPTFNMLGSIRCVARERNLMFNNELNNISLSLPQDIRVSGKLHGAILRRLSARSWCIPDANYFVPPGCPAGIKTFSKRLRPFLGRARRALGRIGNREAQLTTSGSWLLTHEFYRRDLRYRKRIETLIDNVDIVHPDIFDRKAVLATWNSFLDGNIGLLFEIEALFTYAALIEKVGWKGIDV